MIKYLFSILLASFSLFAAEESSSMLPSIMANPKNSENLWHTARNASCKVEFAADAEAGTLKIDNKGGGYGNYRCFLKLAPGKYTVCVMASGKSDNSNIGFEIYSFNAKNAVKAVLHFPAARASSLSSEKKPGPMSSIRSGWNCTPSTIRGPAISMASTEPSKARPVILTPVPSLSGLTA